MDAPQRALRSLRAEELRQLCKEQGLDSKGLKGDLIKRLAQLRADQTGGAAAPSPQRPSPKAKAKAKATASSTPQGKVPGRGRRGAEPAGRKVKSSPSTLNGRGAAAAPSALLRRPSLGAGQGVSAWAASRQQLMKCCRCQAVCDLGFARYSNSPDAFWCALCRFKEMDPFNEVVEGHGVLKLQLVSEPHFAFSLDLPQLKQWRKEGKSVEVRMLRVDSTKAEQVWPRQIHFFANSAEVFAIHPPEEGHKRRDVPQNISAGLKAARNDILVRMVDDDCVGFALVVLLTSPQSTEDLMTQVQACSVGSARQRLRGLLAKQAANSRSGPQVDGEELVCLTSDMLKLRCPITMERVQEPVRGDRCQHMQCFSLEAYMTSNRQMGAFNRRWMCPLCSQTLRPQDLRRDDYVAQILASTPEEVEEVLVDSDGSWRVPTGALQQSGGDSAADAQTPVCAVGETAEDTVDLDSPTQSPAEVPTQSPAEVRQGATLLLDDPEPSPVREVPTGGQAPGSCCQGGASPSKSPSPPEPRTPVNGSAAEPAGGRRRLVLDKVPTPNAPREAQATGDAGGFDLAVAVSSLMGGVFSANKAAASAAAAGGARVLASARQRRLAQLELEDDDTSPATKKAQAKRRLPAEKGKPKRARKGSPAATEEAATPARSGTRSPFDESASLATLGLANGRPIDLD